MLFLTTVFTGDEMEQRLRKRPSTTQPRAHPIKEEFGNEPVKELRIPIISSSCNDLMNAVDIGNQLRARGSGSTHRVKQGGWQAIAWDFLLPLVLTNSYLLQLRGQPH